MGDRFIKLVMVSRCSAITRKGGRCSIDGKSNVRDASGNLVARPLLRGAPYCLFHARPFVTHRVSCDPPFLVLAIDLETTGVDPLRDRVLELGAYQIGVGDYGAKFSSTVHVDASIRQERGAEAAAIHGIPNCEIDSSPSFAIMWARFQEFLKSLMVITPSANMDTDSETDEPTLTPLSGEPPTLVLVAHNGMRFDFCVLLVECIRHDMGTELLEQCLLVDSLSIVRCAAPCDLQGCVKLQCLARRCCDMDGICAHRALDDCVVLAAVLEHIATRYNLCPVQLIRHFTEKFDATASVVGAYLE